MGQVAQLMDHNIIQNGRRCQHETPVKGESPLRATASPACLLITDGNAVVNAAGELLEIGGSLREILFSSGDIPLCQGSTLCLCQIGNRFGSLFVLLLQISGNDPMLFLCENMMDFFVAGL